MEQKEINQRIAHSMLEQCGLLWNTNLFHYGKERKGEYSLNDVIAGLEGKFDDKDTFKTMNEIVNDGFNMISKKKIMAIDGVVDFDNENFNRKVTLSIPTSDTNPNVGFGCSYNINSIFWLAKSYCKSVGCLAMMKKAIFGYDDNGPYSLIPKLKTTKARKARKPSKPKAKPVVLNPAAARIARLREAMKKLPHVA